MIRQCGRGVGEFVFLRLSMRAWRMATVTTVAMVDEVQLSGADKGADRSFLCIGPRKVNRSEIVKEVRLNCLCGGVSLEGWL